MTDRRSLISGIAAALVSGLLSPPAMAGFRRIPQKPNARVIVDNDFSGDPDGLVALAHQLLAPKTVVRAVTSSFLNPKLLPPGTIAGQTAGGGAKVASELITQLSLQNPPRVVAGAEQPLTSLTVTQPTAAAQLIVDTAREDDALPLFVTCGGPLTNVATALLMAPDIARRLTVVWIGGAGYPKGGWEYNLATDPIAAQIVFNHSDVALWQVPQPVYRQCQVSVAEMEALIRPASPLGAWLYDHFTTPPDFVDVAGAWPLGDSPLVLLTALSTESSTFVEQTPVLKPDFAYGISERGRRVRVCTQIDFRLLIADFYARLQLQAREV